MDTQRTSKLPCVGAEELKEALLSHGDPPIAALYDLVEIADSCGASSIHVFVDERLFKTESLLHPGLAPFQGIPFLQGHLSCVNVSTARYILLMRD